MTRAGPLLALAALIGALPLAAAAPEAGPIAVIVHPQRAASLDADELAQIYLRRRRFWDDGRAIVPLNLPAGSSLRLRFVQQVLHQPERHLADYWNRRYFDGVFPPATLASTAAVRRYVAGDRNAIGYLPADEVDASVQVILRLE